MERLSEQTLGHDALTAIERPRYARTGLRTGQVHIGLGAFHRAHQALYTEQVMNQTGDVRWGIAGVSLRSPEVASRLMPQDRLFSVFERHGEEVHGRIVGALTAAWHAPTQWMTVRSALANPDVKVITLTVTEKAYGQLAASGSLDVNHPDVAADLGLSASATALAFDSANPPRSVLGVLCAGLSQRPDGALLNVVCCDNMNRNGELLRALMLEFAQHLKNAPSGMVDRIRSQLSFPNTMVDRIVPAASTESLDWASARLGLRDESALVCEPFTQWVIEDHFITDRPAWELAGAMIVSDVGPFQDMKLRLLNAAHSAIAYLGQLCDQPTVADVMTHPVLAGFIRSLMRDELLAVTPIPTGYSAAAYIDDLLRRFENPSLAHRTEQIAMDGTQKVAVRWLPALRESVKRNQPLPKLEFALAAWLHHLETARSDRGAELRIHDPGAPALQLLLRQANSAQEAVRLACTHESVFGTDASTSCAAWPKAWVDRVALALGRIRERGVLASISSLA